MKVLIDVSENRYKVLKEFKEAGCGLGYLEEAVLQGVVISDNATNGDMIKAMWNIRDEDIDIGTYTVYVYGDFPRIIRGYVDRICFDADWWNSPYRKEQE